MFRFSINPLAVHVLIGIASCTAMVAPVYLHAEEPVKAEAFALPEGYSNARTATDPNRPQPATLPGELRSYATLHSLGFEWDITGDTNHNAVCRVAYRRADETGWHEALPLFRVDFGGWYDQRPADRPYNMLAGSVMFLRPGSEYRVRLSLADADGGSIDKELTMRTKPVPDAGPPSRTLHVTPRLADDASPPGDGSADKPLRGIKEAQRIGQPGDRFLLHTGAYGEGLFDRSGSPAAEAVGAQSKYIVWQAAGDGPAEFSRLDVAASHVWFEGLSFRKVDNDVALKARSSATDVVVRANTFRDFHYAILLANDSAGWYIADNDIIGDVTEGISGEGVELNKSSGHTVCYNRVTRSADGVSYPQRNCDIFGNDVFGISDDAIEPDYGYANIRIWGNRLEGPVGISFQPMYCGPWYIVRNQATASTCVFKLRVQDRYLIANNTFIGHGPDAGAKLVHAHGLLTATSRNNLWIHAGGSAFLWVAPIDAKNRDYVRKHVLFDTMRADWRTDVDYDGFDWSAANPHRKGEAPVPFVWKGVRLANLAALADAIGIERHGKQVDKARVFENYTAPTAGEPFRRALVLRPDGEAVDAGAPLANVAEEFSGSAPDFGAVEAGTAPPHVGPRGPDWRQRHEDWTLRHQR